MQEEETKKTMCSIWKEVPCIQFWMKDMQSVWGNLATQGLHEGSSVSMNQWHLIFLTFIIYVTQFNVNMVN